MRTRSAESLFMVWAVIAVSSASAATFHVAPDGRDTNSGTARRPFATLPAARDAARAVPGPNTILLAPGRYFNEAVIVLDDRDSGLTIRGMKPGAEADFSRRSTVSAEAEVYGGVPVTGWERWKGDIWRAPVPKGQRFFNLIVDGKQATMAQTPNAGSGFRGGAERRGNTSIWVPPEWRGYDYSDAQVACSLGSDWFSEMREVVKAPDAQSLLTVDGGSGGTQMNDHFVLRGVLEFLDEPGEWCLKHEEGYLYYWPARMGTPTEHLIVRPVAEKLIDVHGRTPQTPAKNITLENLSLIGSDFCLRWYLFPPDNAIKINSYPEPLRQGLVYGENVEGLTISGCKILAAGHSGVFLNLYAKNCVIENSLIAQAGANGIMLNGWIAGEGPFNSPEESDVNKGHRIENNFIYDCGTFVPLVAAIEVFQSGDLLIARNEISQMARCGIMLRGVRWGSMAKKLYGKDLDTTNLDDYFRHMHSRNIRIIGNEIYSVCRSTDDFGAIECWGVGRDHLWENNEVHDIDHSLGWETWGHALFVDDSAHWVTVRGNIVHHFHGGRATGALMLKNIEQVIENNLVIDSTVGRVVSFEPYIEPAWNMSIRHNIFAVDGTGSRYGGVNEFSLKGKPFEGIKVPQGATGFREIDYNWITPRDPNNPNPVAPYGMDLHSTFGPAPVKRLKPDWDLTAADYQIEAPPWFKPIDTSKIGLKKDFPFDTQAFTRRLATDTIQAEDYQRIQVVRTLGGYGIHNLLPGSWAKYANIDFGKGVSTAVFQMEGPSAEANPPKRFIRRTANTVVEAVPFKGDASVETVPQWEISQAFTQAGKTGPELFDVAFPPETDPKAGEWSLLLRPATSKGGVTPEQGVVDFYVAHGEGPRDACAYARTSIHTQRGRTNATMTLTTTGGAKVWLNGDLIFSANKPGAHTIHSGVIREGWNNILVKVSQGAEPGAFSFTFGTVASACGKIVALPGLPDAAQESGTLADTILELRLDSPEGELIGKLDRGQTECPVEKARGIRNLYLVFPGGEVRSVDWLRFEP